ncbi:MAG: phosphate signaling complex protein PhoU [Candidatus Omnitrophica bacterium]|nr:phosphate signaling complex protein PhoU [Candidatus Omnitrophota bacterium]
MERHFDEELTKLKTDLIRMDSLVEEAIYKSVEAIKNRDRRLAEEVIEGDNRIDDMENSIEEDAISLLALRQPMAVDLRFITTGMKINAELERIADLAVNIAQRALEICDQPLLKPMINIPKLSNLAIKMLKGSIDAFVNKDENLAKEIILTDPQADALKNSIKDELVNEYMIKDPSTVTRAVPLILVARHLERICDHATNIAEDVIYMVQARVVKHRNLIQE